MHHDPLHHGGLETKICGVSGRHNFLRALLERPVDPLAGKSIQNQAVSDHLVSKMKAPMILGTMPVVGVRDALFHRVHCHGFV